jgi:hypothetical protein
MTSFSSHAIPTVLLNQLHDVARFTDRYHTSFEPSGKQSQICSIRDVWSDPYLSWIRPPAEAVSDCHTRGSATLDLAN